MELKTKAYISTGAPLVEGYLPVFVASNALIIVNDEIVSMPLTPHGAMHIDELHSRTKYELKFLDKYHNPIVTYGYDVQLKYRVRSQLGHYVNESIYIKISDFEKQQLKWAHKMFWVQKPENFKWIITSIIALVGTTVALYIKYH